MISYEPNAYNMKVGNLVMLAIPSVYVGVVAAGDSASNAATLGGQVSFQEVKATGPDQGVMLPPISMPSSVSIVNIGTYPILVYPNSGCTIYNEFGPITVEPGPPATRLVASSPTNWYH